MKDLSWFEPGTPLDADEIRAAENRLGVNFPQDYIDFVKPHSGASNPDKSEFEYYDQGMKRVGNFGTLLSLVESDAESVFETIGNLSEQIPDRVIPVVDTGSGDCVCFDYRNLEVPKVIYFAHERSGEQSLLPLAGSFSEFVDKLQEPMDD